jgi:hypothetical protein
MQVFVLATLPATEVCGLNRASRGEVSRAVLTFFNLLTDH